MKMIIVIILHKVDKAASTTPAPIPAATGPAIPCPSSPCQGGAMVVVDGAALLLAVGGGMGVGPGGGSAAAGGGEGAGWGGPGGGSGVVLEGATFTLL